MNDCGFQTKTLRDEQLKAQRLKLALLTHEQKGYLFFGNIAANPLKNHALKSS
jgi:hypothetical protein